MADHAALASIRYAILVSRRAIRHFRGIALAVAMVWQIQPPHSANRHDAGSRSAGAGGLDGQDTLNATITCERHICRWALCG